MVLQTFNSHKTLVIIQIIDGCNLVFWYSAFNSMSICIRITGNRIFIDVSNINFFFFIILLFSQNYNTERRIIVINSFAFLNVFIGCFISFKNCYQKKKL
jgi:hypothetical protein